MYFASLRYILHSFIPNIYISAPSRNLGLLKGLFCVKYFVTLSAGCIQFNLVLCIMFQSVFSVFLFIYRTLNCHSHSANTKPRNRPMFVFLLFIKRMLID